MESRGGVTGGSTSLDVLRELSAQGFGGSFTVQSGGRLECGTCHARLPADQVNVRSLRRVEGASDPSDMLAIGALVCPTCGARGTATFTYGAHTPPDDAEVLRLLDHRTRPSRIAMSDDDADASLVNDTGWIDRSRV